MTWLSEEWLSEKELKRERKKLFKLVKGKLKQLLRNFYRFKKVFPNASKEELYLDALKYVGGIDETDAKSVLDLCIESAKRKNEPINLRRVANTMLLLGLPPEYNSIVKQNTESRFVWDLGLGSQTTKPKPKLEETFTSYSQIVESVIPSDV